MRVYNIKFSLQKLFEGVWFQDGEKIFNEINLTELFSRNWFFFSIYFFLKKKSNDCFFPSLWEKKFNKNISSTWKNELEKFFFSKVKSFKSKDVDSESSINLL